ncbi:hypothetical protein L7F22_027776 [Adiantum nelumboides]|nr:hypothetical protein [Adiantum nelumboides]
MMYRRTLGSLIYMTISRPNLSYAIGLVSQFMQLPRKPYLDVVRRIMRYLRATLDYALFYDASTQVQTHGYTNFDWVGADIKTRLGRVLTFSWLLAMLIFTSSYTASLTSILGPKLLVPSIANLKELRQSNLSIGHQRGSFLHNFTKEYLNISYDRLKYLDTEEDYEQSLRNRTVMAILEELPYVQAFINSECEFTKMHSQLAYFGGFGFALKKNSSLTKDISMEILKLEQTGELQAMRDRWLGVNKCGNVVDKSNDIPFREFIGLFIVVGVLYGIFILLRVFVWCVSKLRNN